MYLTTRPEELSELTREELVTSGFPDLPVVARPQEIALENTTTWKISVLLKLSSQLLPHGLISLLMIDDSVSLHTEISQMHHPGIASILHAGPITPPHSNAQAWPQISQTIQTLYSR